MSYNLFLDDEREPPNDGRCWKIARTSQAAILLFHQHGVPDLIAFDHDLGNDDEATLYVDWVIGLCLDLIDLGVDKKMIKFPRNYWIHSQNPEGARNIEGKMEGFIKFLDSP